MLLVSMVWLMIGCIYIPTFESHDLNGAKRDYRRELGRPGQGRPITVGRITRRKIESLLGPPPFESDGQRAIAYVVTGNQGIWLSPLCLDARSATVRQYAVKMVFDDDGVLQRWETRCTSGERQPAGFAVGAPMPDMISQPFTGIEIFDHEPGQVSMENGRAVPGPEFLRPRTRPGR